MKKGLIVFLITFFLMFMVSAIAHAETSSSSGELFAKKYGITFPIPDLGNCNTLAECKSYCGDPLHKDECINFAKKKGFYKEQKLDDQKSTTLGDAKNELGCDSTDTCKTFCGQQENWQKCGEFAKKHHLSGGQTADPGKKDILSKAKDILGCDSIDVCKGFCTKEENKIKCDEFAKLVGLRGGNVKQGPQSLPAYEHANEMAKFCRQYPEKCKNATSSGVVTPEQYCREHPDRCPKPYPSASFDPAKKCVEYKCNWTGNSCICDGKTVYPPPSPYPSYTPTSYQDYCQSKGCSWTGSSCVCSTGTYTPAPTYSPTPYPTYSTTTSGNIGTTSSVKGVSTVRNLFQRLLDFLR